jgi:hypothetical protein
MTMLIKLAGAAALAGTLAAPAAAQVQIQPVYPPNSYPQQPYPGNGYGYQQPYGQNVVGSIIDQLLGNRYNVTDRQAVSQCAQASILQAQNQYRNWGYGQPGYNQWGNNWRQNYNRMRVTAITNVERRGNGLRVSGLIDSGRSMYTQGYNGGGYGGQGYNGGSGQQGYGQGYNNQGYGNRTGDLSFRCNVDWRGSVTGIRIRDNGWQRRY